MTATSRAFSNINLFLLKKINTMGIEQIHIRAFRFRFTLFMHKKCHHLLIDGTKKLTLISILSRIFDNFRNRIIKFRISLLRTLRIASLHSAYALSYVTTLL